MTKIKKTSGYHVVKFKTNDEWKASREQGIGSSEVGAILDQSIYSTPRDVWKAKLGMSEPIVENFAMELGHAMEPWLAKCFEENTGINIIKSSAGDWLAIDNEKSYLRVSPDRTYWIPGEKHNDSGKGIAECKTSQKNYDEDAMYNEMKSWYCQLQYQLHVMRMSEGYLCFMCLDIRHEGARWFVRIPYNKKFCEEVMLPKLDEFWNKYIIPARQFIEANKITDPLHMPAEYLEAINEFAPPCSTAKDIADMYKHQEDGKVVSTDDAGVPDLSVLGIGQTFEDVIIRHSAICSQIKDLENIKSQIEDSIKMYMKDAETLIGCDGNVLATWKQNKSSVKFNEKAFRNANPKEYEKYTEMKPGARVLKIKK